MGPFWYIFHDPNIGMQYLIEITKSVSVNLLSMQHNIQKLMEFYNNHSIIRVPRDTFISVFCLNIHFDYILSTG